MRLFKRLEDMTPQEVMDNAEAKVWVLSLFSRSQTGWPPEGRLSREVRLQTYGNLLSILVVAILFLTGAISEGLYVFGIVSAFVFAILLSALALYGLYRDVRRADD